MSRKRDISFGRERRMQSAEKEEYKNEKNSLAARVVMILGAASLIFFLVFASFGKNSEPIDYIENDSFGGEGIVAVFSQLVSSDGGTVDNSKGMQAVGENEQHEKGASADSDEEKWNLWQYLCDSFAELFGVG